MAWWCLFVAGLLEVLWAIGLKSTDGFSRLWPSVWTLGAMAASILLLSISLKTIQVGTAYAVWTGIGVVGTTLLGMMLLGEPAEAGRIVALIMIVCGVVALRSIG